MAPTNVRSTKIKRSTTKNKKHFYINLLDALIQFNKDYRPSDQEILSESIWFSDWTKYGRAIVKRWDDRGLRFIGDLYNSESRMIYSRQELENNYKIQINFLCYATLVLSLPQRFQKQVNNEYLSKPNIPYKIEMIQKRKKFSRTAYHVFVEKITDKHKNSNERLQAKWTTDVGVFKEGTLQTINKVTKSTCLLYLQFRIINRIYATNKYLMSIQVIQHNTCSFCESTAETIFHLYWQCPVTQIFIKEILSHLRTKYNTVLNINCGSWFMLTDLTNIEVIIVMLCKQCICYGPYQKPGSINAARAVLILTGGAGSINAARSVLILTGESVSINTDRAVSILTGQY